jgi:hypothetical protein
MVGYNGSYPEMGFEAVMAKAVFAPFVDNKPYFPSSYCDGFGGGFAFHRCVCGEE